jgi:hypothetical protein
MATVAIPAATNLADSLAIGLVSVSDGLAIKVSGSFAHSLASKVSASVLPSVVCLSVPLTITYKYEGLHLAASVSCFG